MPWLTVPLQAVIKLRPCKRKIPGKADLKLRGAELGHLKNGRSRGLE
jgi:hypothetical protein